MTDLTLHSFTSETKTYTFPQDIRIFSFILVKTVQSEGNMAVSHRLLVYVGSVFTSEAVVR